MTDLRDRLQTVLNYAPNATLKGTLDLIDREPCGQLPLTDAYQKGYEDATQRAVDLVMAQVGDERLCPSRARLTDWNASMTKLAGRLRLH